ncbi:exonuclease domain-containing protein [Oerskovia sp. M15]
MGQHYGHGGRGPAGGRERVRGVVSASYYVRPMSSTTASALSSPTSPSAVGTSQLSVRAFSPPVTTGARPVQLGLDELGTPLRDVTFVVVDLETTGGSPATAGITEIGAVKVRGGEVLGEFQTLVDPGTPVPAFIARLTGITSAMVANAPPIEAVLPSFLEFARGAVLVAHNAPFDIGFLKAAARDAGYEWPGNQVLDTVPLARRVVTRDEAPNHKLSTLAALFRATVTPSTARWPMPVPRSTCSTRCWSASHRSASRTWRTSRPRRTLYRRTCDASGRSPTACPTPLASTCSAVPGGGPLRRDLDLDPTPRPELFHRGREAQPDDRDDPHRARRHPVVCATVLEAQVRELRLIAEHSPRYNRRSKFPERMSWVRLTQEHHPRLSIVKEVQPDAAHIGPTPRDARPSRRSTRCTTPSRCASARRGCPAPCPGRERVRPGGDGAVRRPCTTEQEAGGYPRWRAARGRPCSRTP